VLEEEMQDTANGRAIQMITIKITPLPSVWVNVAGLNIATP
jgi:hypothetical protein